MQFNQRAADLCDVLVRQADVLRAQVHVLKSGARVIDLGIAAQGGWDAGLMLAEICTAGLARIALVPAAREYGGGPAAQVHTDHPLAACMASQYAGWEIKGEKFFAMGSGPMRAAAGKEALFDKIGHRESPAVAVGVLETRKLPTEAIAQDIAAACGLAADKLTLLVAPTASFAGTLQVVARSVETALHKLFELGFDLSRVVSAYGIAPLPAVAADDLRAIGRTNDAILYGAEVTLWVRGDDASLAEIGPRVPSNSSPDHGQPFAALFERYGRDFYKIDPHLFSPAVVTFNNLDTGRVFCFGELRPDVLRW
jgi:methenyltetrahydromethanopterin cyclohydrolase